MKKIAITVMLLIISIFVLSNITLAYNLELILSADKSNVKVGDTVTVTLTLSKGMQAADFILNYDSSLLKFESTSLEKNFYNAQEPGKIVCSWFDTNDTVSFDYKFTALSSGNAQFTTKTENFYDGSLQAASSYNEGNLNITLLSASSNITNPPIIPDNNNNNDVPNNNQNSSGVQQIGGTNNNNSNNNSNNTNNIPNINTSNTQTNNNKENSSDEKLPQTGDNTIIFISTAVGIIMLAIITKIKLNKLRDI